MKACEIIDFFILPISWVGIVVENNYARSLAIVRERVLPHFYLLHDQTLLETGSQVNH